MIHQPTGGFQGQSTDIEIHAREALALRARLEEIVSAHTGQEPERVHADMERDHYMTAERSRRLPASSTASCASAAVPTAGGEPVSR